MKDYKAEAIAAIENGFSSKAAQKRVFEQLNRAYETLRDEFKKAVVYPLAYPLNDGVERDSIFEKYDLPFDLHHYREAKHAERVGEWADGFAELVSLRELAKATPITPPESKTDTQLVATRDTITDIMARAEKHYSRAVAIANLAADECEELGEIFKGLPVSVQARFCVNAHGTHYVQHFFWLNGKITPLSLIMAAAQTVADERNNKG